MRQNRVEWIALVVSILAIAGVVVLLAADALSTAGMPPQPVVQLEADGYATEAGWVQPATARNLGGEAAETIAFRASAQVGDATETSDVTIDYLPAGSEARIFFAFSARPSGEISVRIVGFRAP